MKVRVCPYCKKEFDCRGRVFSNHVRWCSENPNRKNVSGENFRNKLSEALNKANDKKLGIIKDFIVVCSTCGKEFVVQEREKQFPKKDKYFCSRSCANKRERPQEVKDKIAKSLKVYNGTDGIENKCVICGKIIIKKSKAKTCSKECHDILVKQNFKNKTQKIFEKVAGSEEEYKIKLRHYRNCCAFKFALNDYPEEFDFELVKKYGWYRPSNKGDNLNGISRDHMYSVKDGFENNVPPEILAHPANCKLLVHNDNISKHKKSSISLNELKERIEHWDNKYR